MTLFKKNTNGQLRMIQAKIADVNYGELLDTLSKYVKICFQLPNNLWLAFGAAGLIPDWVQIQAY